VLEWFNKSLDIVYGETFPQTSNFGDKFVVGVEVSTTDVK
jgi:hypothetical protein